VRALVPEYTVLAVVAVLVTVVLERWSGTRVFSRLQFWLSMLIVVAFQVVVDGWLTKLSAPIVQYNPEHHLGLRFPWDVPVEDYLFGFAMVASTIILWERAKAAREAREALKALKATTPRRAPTARKANEDRLEHAPKTEHHDEENRWTQDR
jgi:lycopene cyclase domain-containing protein